MSEPKAGWKGAIYRGATKIAGMANWTYGGETRNMQDRDELEDEIIKQVPLQKVGGDISISGNYLLDTDAGQKLLKTLFDAATEVTDIRLYTDKTNSIYLTPKSGSHVIITNVNNSGVDKSGVGTWSCTMHVNGEMEQIGSTTAVAVATVGDVNVTWGSGDMCTVTLLGKLLSIGEEGTVDLYFEYGKTDSYGTDTSGSADTKTSVDDPYFDNDLTSLDDDSTYHFRAVALLADTSKVYGKDKTFDTPAA